MKSSPPTIAPAPSAKPRKKPTGPIVVGVVGLAVVVALLIVYWQPLWHFTQELWEILQDREAFRARIESYGVWAPLAFVVFQIFQVLVSPIPGELVGAAGGYVFGWFPSWSTPPSAFPSAPGSTSSPPACWARPWWSASSPPNTWPRYPFSWNARG